MITCTRLIQFCSGHRVVGHENKCANVHGHNYKAEIFAHALDLDNLGRVIDFSILKEKVGEWIDENWDHTFIASPTESPILLHSIQTINQKPIYYLKGNPTAENMAEHLLKDICPKLMEGTNVFVTKIVLWETENCFVTAEYDRPYTQR